MSENCPTCGQPIPSPCDRCGTPALRRYSMRHRSGTPVVWWCRECYGDWLRAKEFREYEDSGVVKGAAS